MAERPDIAEARGDEECEQWAARDGGGHDPKLPVQVLRVLGTLGSSPPPVCELSHTGEACGRSGLPPFWNNGGQRKPYSKTWRILEAQELPNCAARGRLTLRFCDRRVERRSRTHDRKAQAAR